jgi:hypothetical protein
MQISNDHPHPPIWDLTSYDINRIKGQLQTRRVRIDAKYAEDSKALDDEFAELETLERLAASVALKYRADDAPERSEENSAKIGENGPPDEADVMPEAQALTVPADNGGDPEPKATSRWRLALRE